MMAGGCLCGAVRYEVDGEPVAAGFCHCRDCLKATSSGYAPYMGFARSGFRVTGRYKTYTTRAAGGNVSKRNFCPECGSIVFGGDLDSAVINIYAGTLDDPSRFEPRNAIFTRDRPDWARVAIDVPEFEMLPP